MVTTPWGDPGAEETADRRERLYAAMVVSCAERGYEATTVADLLRLSGLSRASFYGLFENKTACFVATLEALLKGALAVIGESYRVPGDWEKRARAALESFLALAAAQPAAARLCLVEAYAAGASGLAPVGIAVDRLERLGLQALEQMPGRSGMSEDLARAIIGGFHRVLYRRLHQGRGAELVDLAEPLWNWSMSYRPPPRPLRPSRRRARLDRPPAPPSFAAIDTDQRVIRAFAAVAAEKSYAAATIADVAGAAGISQRTFYEHFAGKQELLEAALDSSGAQLAAAILPAVRRVPEWPGRVRVGFEAMSRFLVAEPAFARLREVEVYAAGPEAIELRDRAGSEILAEFLRPTTAVPAEDHPIFAEATVGAIYSTLHHQLREGDTQGLLDLPPFLTYVALAPVIGPERACEVANGGGRARQ